MALTLTRIDNRPYLGCPTPCPPMQIACNTSGMLAGLFVATDREARDHCVVVIKGTFDADAHGRLTLAAEQRPLVHADEHYGDPATTSIKYACDFVPEKTATDVLVVGKAMAPRRQPVEQLPVRLEVQGRTKELMVIGERQWLRAFGLIISKPVPFVEMPLTFERGFGGTDSSRGPERLAVEDRNLIGVGFHAGRTAREIEGMPLPNLEHPRHRIKSPKDKPEPVGFGCLGCNWQPRLKYAGTYDKQWRDKKAPFLPDDFDSRYFQSAPEDQQFPIFRGGEMIRCLNMSPTSEARYQVPALDLHVTFKFDDRIQRRQATLDTVILEPHLPVVMLVWRARMALGKKLTALREIFVGDPPALADGIVGFRNGKPLFRGLGAAIRWRRRQRGAGG